MTWIIIIAIIVGSLLWFRKRWIFMKLIDNQAQSIVGSYAALSSPKKIIDIEELDKLQLLQIKLHCAAAFYLASGQFISKLPQAKFDRIMSDLMMRTKDHLLSETLKANSDSSHANTILAQFQSTADLYLKDSLPISNEYGASILSVLADNIKNIHRHGRYDYSYDNEDLQNAFINFMTVVNYNQFGKRIARVV